MNNESETFKEIKHLAWRIIEEESTPEDAQYREDVITGFLDISDEQAVQMFKDLNLKYVFGKGLRQQLYRIIDDLVGDLLHTANSVEITRNLNREIF